ncbi:GDP-mannose 4,6-dehydratase [mine drainage metagenome]|uniref:GDP-mannose 4,6-dehydratase n=1 Tax=mine drainage metagenome TaxID=410659 RepID=A0A1J5Q336_9ZZZZ
MCSLLGKGYIVHGIKRRASSFNTQRVDHIDQDPHIDHAKFRLHTIHGPAANAKNATLQHLVPNPN